MKGQNVYKEHLPLLGELGPGRTGPHGLQVGDQVSFFCCIFNKTDLLIALGIRHLKKVYGHIILLIIL